MSHHNILSEIPGPQWDAVADPGDAGAIPRDQMGNCNLVSATTETRTLADPVRSGVLLGLNFQTDGGNITVTVTNGYDENANTTLTFSNAGEFALLISRKVGSNYRWRLISATPGLTQSETAVLDGVTPGTAAASKAVVLDANGNVTWVDGGDVALGTTTGTKIGTAVSQKLGFFNATPVVQPADAGQGALTNSSGGSADGTLEAVGATNSGDVSGAINNNFTELHTLLDEIRTALVNLGIIKGDA